MHGRAPKAAKLWNIELRPRLSKRATAIAGAVPDPSICRFTKGQKKVTGSQAVVLLIAVIGICLIAWSSNRLSIARHLPDEVLSPAVYSRTQIREIRRAVHRDGELPADASLHTVSLQWARDESELGRPALKWVPFTFLGTVMVVSGLYLIPGFMIPTIVLQSALVILGIGTTSSARRGIAHASSLGGNIRSI
jgi:hypothetical protein